MRERKHRDEPSAPMLPPQATVDASLVLTDAGLQIAFVPVEDASTEQDPIDVARDMLQALGKRVNGSDFYQYSCCLFAIDEQADRMLFGKFEPQTQMVQIIVTQLSTERAIDVIQVGLDESYKIDVAIEETVKCLHDDGLRLTDIA